MSKIYFYGTAGTALAKISQNDKDTVLVASQRDAYKTPNARTHSWNGPMWVRQVFDNKWIFDPAIFATIVGAGSELDTPFSNYLKENGEKILRSNMPRFMDLLKKHIYSILTKEEYVPKEFAIAWLYMYRYTNFGKGFSFADCIVPDSETMATCQAIMNGTIDEETVREYCWHFYNDLEDYSEVETDLETFYKAKEDITNILEKEDTEWPQKI